MKTVDTTNIDRWTERVLALIGVLITGAGLSAGQFPRAAVALLLVLTVLLIVTAVVSERARKGLPDRPDYSNTDTHLSDLCNNESGEARTGEARFAKAG